MAPNQENQHKEGAKQSRRNRVLFWELWGLVSETRKWWMIPILAVILLFGLLVLLAGTPLGPWVYTLF
jgi:hypothetical protein